MELTLRRFFIVIFPNKISFSIWLATKFIIANNVYFRDSILFHTRGTKLIKSPTISPSNKHSPYFRSTQKCNVIIIYILHWISCIYIHSVNGNALRTGMLPLNSLVFTKKFCEYHIAGGLFHIISAPSLNRLDIVIPR
jgi:hypothetical protein